MLPELLQANGVLRGPRTRKDKLGNAMLRLVANLGSSIRLPAGLSRASDGVTVAPAISPDQEGPGDDATMRTFDVDHNQVAQTKPPGVADQRTGDPLGAPQRPVHGHGGPMDAPGLTTELPPMLHCAPDYLADPDCGKLSVAVLAALERLPL